MRITTMNRWFPVLVAVCMTTTVAAALYDSSYSPIDEASCTTLFVDQHGISSTQRCPAFGSWGVIVQEGDLRQSITLERDGKAWPLDFWRTVSPAWSYLGKVIEWRHERGNPGNPVAMIVRLDVSENPVEPDRTTSYLVVSRIGESAVCVVGRIAPQKDGSQNLKAREMADFAAALPCL